MKIFKNISLLILAAFVLSSCKKYDSYITDFDYNVVYFGTQKPVRTIVAYDDMSFKVGVTIGGVRENPTDQTIKYQIDPTLLTTVAGASAFTLLPPSYYTLSDNSTMIIPKGKLIGDVTVTLNKALFTADPKSLTNVYALPLRIVSSTTDSILKGSATVAAKDYTILVVKYISPYHGTYYQKGKETNLATNVASSYTNKDLSRNITLDLATLSLNAVKSPNAGKSANVPLNLNISNNTAVTITGNTANSVSGSGTYDPTAKSFYLNYKYTNAAKNYSVLDTLILRQAPELDLRFETW
jgi:hypothetical protein